MTSVSLVVLLLAVSCVPGGGFGSLNTCHAILDSRLLVHLTMLCNVNLSLLQASEGIIFGYGRRSPTVSIASLLRPFWMRRFSAATEVSLCWSVLSQWQPSSTLVSPAGLSPDLQSMEQIRRIMRPTDVPDQGNPATCSPQHGLLTFELSFVGLLCDLLWADPDKETMGWGENDRGVSFTFGPEIVSKFLAKHDLDLICRAHQASY